MVRPKLIFSQKSGPAMAGLAVPQTTTLHFTWVGGPACAVCGTSNPVRVITGSYRIRGNYWNGHDFTLIL